MIQEYFIRNRDYLKELINPLTVEYHNLLVTTDPLFKEEVDKQYIDRVKSIIANECASRLSYPLEDVLIIVEYIDLKEYIK